MTRLKPFHSFLPVLACSILSATIFSPAVSAAGSHLGELLQLTASDGAAGDQLGFAAALSNDGSTALVGAYGQNNNVGAAYVFTGTAGNWTQQAKLLESDPRGFDYFGYSVALSTDGNTALVGAFTRNTYKGAAYVFVRSGTAWTQQAELTPSDPAIFDFFGYSVALSADGNTALVSAPSKSQAQGAAYTFTRDVNGNWTQQQKLTATQPGNNDNFGFSVALSGDAKTALLGAPQTNATHGGAYIFNFAGGVWSQQQELAPSDGADSDQFGQWVALSADGSTAVFGVVKRAYVYSLAGGVWSQQQELFPSDGLTGVVGSTVALSNDGNIALLGSDQENGLRGAAYVFTRASALWTQQQTLMTRESVGGDEVGSSVGLAGDGSVALLGSVFGNSGNGAAYIFTSDVIPPTAAPAQSPLPNAAGWNNTDVLVTWHWADNPGGSGVDPANCTTSTSSTGEGTFAVTAPCSDLAGNVANGSFTVKVDKTNPAVTASGKNLDGTLYNFGKWTNQTVTVSFACTDSTSGVASCDPSQVFPATTQSVSGSGSDIAGNTGTGTFGPILIDRIAPTISAAATSSPNAKGWYNTNVAVRFTCQDADSGVPVCPADQILSTDGTAVSSAPTTVKDAAGNSSAPSNVVTVMIDETSPTVTYSGNLKTYGVDVDVAITCTATDALSGIATTTCSDVSGAAYAIGVGSHTYSANAVDVAGNTGTGSTTFSIVVTFSGVTNLVNRWESKSGISAQMVTTLQAAQAAFASGAVNSGDNQLKSFSRQVTAQSGKSLTVAQANLLTQYAQALME